MDQPTVINSTARLEAYVSHEKYRGYDPYDALRSPLLRALASGSKKQKIVATQAIRRLPWNFRPCFGITKDYNPKGLGLMLASYVKLAETSGEDQHLVKAKELIPPLKRLASSNTSGYCWGYNFDWQSRAFFIPKGTPTMVNTSYIAQGFLDAYEALHDRSYLDIAASSCQFILHDLNRWEEGDKLAYSYTPIDDTRVHNANMLGAALLARVYSITGDRELKDAATKMVNYVMSCQLPNGGWNYAETSYQKWIDSFHTGFVLESLWAYQLYSGDDRYNSNLQRGLDFYKREFFGEDGRPYYYNNRKGPVDIHSPAQGIVTLCRLAELDSDCMPLAEKILEWTIRNMQDPKGYFYFRKGRFFTNKIPYMRWGQAWMFHALTTYLSLAQRGKERAQ